MAQTTMQLINEALARHPAGRGAPGVTAASRVFSLATRERLAEKTPAQAMPDGSYPIPDKGALARAISAYGRAAPADRAAVRAHIKRRAKALGAEDSLPKDWK